MRDNKTDRDSFEDDGFGNSELDRMRQLDHAPKLTRAEAAELEGLLDERRRGKF